MSKAKKKPSEVGDVRADGAVCTKVEWVAKDPETGDYFSRRWMSGLTPCLKDAMRFRSRADAEEPATDPWEAIRVVTWRKPKVLPCPVDHVHGHWCPTNTATPYFLGTDRNRAALLSIDMTLARRDLNPDAFRELVKRYLDIAR